MSLILSVESNYFFNLYNCAAITTVQFLNMPAAAAAAAKSLQSCPTLWDLIDGSPPGSPIPGAVQARTLQWVAISFSSASKWKVKVKLLSRVRLSDTMDCSLPGFSVHGIFQASVLEWLYMTSRKTLALRIWTLVGKLMSQLLNTLSRFVIAFLPRSNRLLISWLQSPSTVILKSRKIVCHWYHFAPIYLPWSVGTRCHDLSFLNVEF